MEENYSKFGNEEKSLEERVKDAAERGEIGYRLYQDLFSARREDLNWETFYTLLDIPSEKENGYWLSAKVASTLLGPTISIQFFKNQNARINERVDEDFLSEVIMEIRRVIPNFDRSKSEFPNYAKLYIKQCGYVHNKDYSVYLQKRKNIRVFSQNSISENNKDDNTSSQDGYSKIASSGTIEEEIEKKEIKRKNAIFNQVVVNKMFSSTEDQKIHADVQQLFELKDEARLLRMTDRDNKTNTHQQRIADIENMLENETSKKAINNDLEKTFVNACLWTKFLGGVDSYDNLFFSKVVDAIDKEEV